MRKGVAHLSRALLQYAIIQGSTHNLDACERYLYHGLPEFFSRVNHQKLQCEASFLPKAGKQHSCFLLYKSSLLWESTHSKMSVCSYTTVAPPW